MNIFQYFQEVRSWGKKLLEFLHKRDEYAEERADFIEKVESLLAKIADEQRLNEQLAREVSQEVEQIHGEIADFFQEVPTGRVPIGKHTLPPLPYSYNALEPYISKEIMMLHHTVHHQKYVNDLNKAELALKEAREKNNFDLVNHWSREGAFNGSGHYLHTIFWNNMSREGGGQPTGQLLQQIEQDFGSFEKFKEHFSAAANKVEGVGWVLLVWVPRAYRLEILQTEKHQFFTQWDTIPLLVLDMWEHAYYLQYKTNKKEYIKNWWRIVNWNNVAERFRKARMLKWQTF